MKNLARTILLLSAVMISIAATSGSEAAVKAEPLTFSGSVTGWSVDASGTVALRLEGERKGEPFQLWFATPANRTTTTRFEELVLEAVLSLSKHGTKDARVSVIADVANEQGRTADTAIVLTALRRE